MGVYGGVCACGVCICCSLPLNSSSSLPAVFLFLALPSRSCPRCLPFCSAKLASAAAANAPDSISQTAASQDKGLIDNVIIGIKEGSAFRQVSVRTESHTCTCAALEAASAAVDSPRPCGVADRAHLSSPSLFVLSVG